VSEQPEPETTGTEQSTTESTGLGTDLLKIAAEMGHDIGDTPPPKVEATPEAEPEPEAPEEESETDTEPETEEEEKPEAKKGDKLVPLREVLEEREKKKRANARAEAAEQQAALLQSQLQNAVAPQPTEDDPFKDINDFAALDRLERSYEKAVDLADENPDGAADVVVGRDANGQPLKRDFAAEELVAMRKKADKAIRKFIPERRSYLQQRAVADAEAAKRYPELQDPSTDFYKAAAILANNLLTGRASKEPDVLIWVARAVKQYQSELKEQNGNGNGVKSSEGKKIVAAARQKVAPTPTRTRSFVERGSSSVNVDKSRERLKNEGSAEAAEELVAKLLSGGGSSKRVEPIGE
jgi:hypothetical protein